jgi:hypothetical protein
MSLLSTIESAFQVSESFVYQLITEAQAGEQAALADIEKSWTWVAAHAGEISSDAAMVATGIQTIQAAGVPLPTAATTAINEMNVAVTTLNAAVGASNAGASAIGILAAGYVAAKQAQAAVADAGAAVAGAAPASTPATAAAQTSGSAA